MNAKLEYKGHVGMNDKDLKVQGNSYCKSSGGHRCYFSVEPYSILYTRAGQYIIFGIYVNTL